MGHQHRGSKYDRICNQGRNILGQAHCYRACIFYDDGEVWNTGMVVLVFAAGTGILRAVILAAEV